MAKYKVIQVSMSGGTSHEHIRLVRTDPPPPPALQGSWGVSEVIQAIKAGDYFYTWGDGKIASVEPWPDSQYGPYIRTRADGVLNNNLLALPRF